MSTEKVDLVELVNLSEWLSRENHYRGHDAIVRAISTIKDLRENIVALRKELGEQDFKIQDLEEVHANALTNMRYAQDTLSKREEELNEAKSYILWDTLSDRGEWLENDEEGYQKFLKFRELHGE